MSWRVDRHYGFGVGRVPIQPATTRRREALPLRDALRQARRQGDAPSLVGSLLRVAMSAVLVWMVAFAVTTWLDRGEETTIHMVRSEPEPAPPVQVARVEPPTPVIEPEPVPVEPEPEPVVPEPVPVVPEPVPVPEPPQRADPPPPPMPQIERVARVEPPSPAPEPAARPRAEAPREHRPDLSFEAPASPRAAEALPEPAPRRNDRRFASVRPPPNAPALKPPGLAPIVARSEPAAAPTPRATARKAPTRQRETPRPGLPGPPPARTPAAQPPRPGRARSGPREAPQRSRNRAVASSLALPTVAKAEARSAPPPEPARHSAPRPAAAAPARSSRDDSKLAGVPLGSLAACVSDRREDTLKQRVVAAASSGGRCESSAGRYHFVETRNVNAFLMWIERAPGRRSGDRCAELTHALDCLARQARKESST